MARKELDNPSYNQEQIEALGEKHIRKVRKTLRIVGGILLGIGLIMTAYALLDHSVSVELPTLIVMIAMAVAGAILLIVSFIEFDSYKMGLIAIDKASDKQEKNQKNSIQSKRDIALKKQVINPDKFLDLHDKNGTHIEIESGLAIFTISNGTSRSKVLGPDDIRGIELIIDNEEVYNSKNYDKHTSFGISGEKIGKGIKDLGKIFSFTTVGKVAVGAGTAVSGLGIDRKNDKHEVKECRKVVHNYSFILRLNDLKMPAVVAKNISIELAEELSNTFAIIYGGDTKRIESGVSKQVDVPTVDAKPVNENKQIENQTNHPQLETKQIEQIEQKPTAIDNIELLKKYKELLDTGVITQEEFNEKKKELL